MRRFGIQFYILLPYTLLLILIVSQLGFFYYKQMSSTIRLRSEDAITQTTERISQSLDGTVKDMDRLSAQVIFNSDIKDFFTYSTDTDSFGSYEYLVRQKQLESLLAAFNGPWFIANQINVFNLKGVFLSSGISVQHYEDLRGRIDSARWPMDTLEANGNFILTGPRPSDWTLDGTLNFSLSRAVPIPKKISPAIVEIEQPYTLLEKLATPPKMGGSTAIYIVDDKNTVFFPADQPLRYDKVLWQGQNQFKWVKNPMYPGLIFSGVRSDYTGLLVLLVQNEKELLAPVNRLRNATVLSVLGILFASFLISVLISRNVTAPVRLLQHYVTKINLDNIGLNGRIAPSFKRSSSEINELYRTFSHMKDRLHASYTELIEAHNRENLALYQAMQAQLQPHFLYNTLTSIGSLAEASNAPRVADMCYELTAILRYNSMPVTVPIMISQELQFARSYFKLMEFRYEDSFAYEINIDESLKDTPVPKNLILPFVENSFKHGFQSVRPPWFIRISVQEDETPGDWRLIVEDNGIGLSEEQLETMTAIIRRVTMEDRADLSTISLRGVGGLGVENTLARCRLYWGKKVNFLIENAGNGEGCRIMIAYRKELSNV